MAEKKKAAAKAKAPAKAKATAKVSAKVVKKSAKPAKGVAAKAVKAESKKVVTKAVEKKAAPKKEAPKKAIPGIKAHKPLTDKKKVIKTYAVHEKDTGSAQVQVAILTSRIDALQSHLKDHPKDNHSRKGLLQMVGKRRKHLDYLKGRKSDEYDKLIQDLGLRK